MRKISLYIGCLIILSGTSAFSDGLDRVRENIKKAGCHYYEFINIIDSDIFETVDSTQGSLYLSDNGLYRLELNRDVYVADSSSLYSYSFDNNQVVIENRSPGDDEEIAYLLHFDKYYVSIPVVKDKEYILVRKDDTNTDQPDSLKVTIDPQENILKQMEYFDVNGDLNRIIFLRQDHGVKCDADEFKADFPDTVEKVRM